MAIYVLVTSAVLAHFRVDCLIAAAARERHACLVHRDRHFAAIPGDLFSQLDLAAE